MALSLATLRSRVRLRYERNAASTSSQDAMVNLAINYSLREIYNTVGDNAWFLRRTGAFTVNGQSVVTTMPPNVKRLYRLEDEANRPGYDFDFTLLRYDSDPDHSLIILTQTDGPVTGHFLDIPVDLVLDADTTPLPDEHGELAVLLACQRLAESVANVALHDALTLDLERLWAAMKRDCLRYTRMRREGLRSVYYQGHPSLFQSQW